MKNEEFDLILLNTGDKLRSQFELLSLSQNEFINYCANKSHLLFIENQRFTEEEVKFSDAYKIKKALNKVLAIEYAEDVSIAKLPGTTETFHAVIALPFDAIGLINQINSLKSSIGAILKEYVDERVKINGKWTPVNKALLKAIGKSRANIKQVRRRLNVHEDLYQRISLSCTSSRPSYKKTKLELIEILNKIQTNTSEYDIQLLEKYSNNAEFAYFYDKTYSVVDGNFRYKESVFEDKSNEINKKFKTQKISSPIYIICDKPKIIDLEVKFRNKETKQKKRTSYKNSISKEKLLMSLPVFEYL